jgi:hypothetical protein
MPYYLCKAVLAPSLRLEISEAEYAAIAEAWRSIFALINIEEEWDGLVQNYMELERDLLGSALEMMVLQRDSYEEFQQNRLVFSRRLSNLLHTCRSYIDHTPHYLKALPGGEYVDVFARARSAAYDGHFEYRFMEALRNYAQHRGVPLHGAIYDTSWIEQDGEPKGLARHSVTAAIHLEQIKDDPKFKRQVLADIGDNLGKLDVATTTRAYLGALGGVHDTLRDALRPVLAAWLKTVREAIAKYEAENDGDTLALAIADYTDDHRLISRISIFEAMLERVEGLMRRNASLVNLPRRYVTNEIIRPHTPSGNPTTLEELIG